MHSKKASQRVMCVFDDDVMRLLREARQRAATAAADGLSGRDDRKVPAPGEADDNSMDASAVALKRLYDLYGICAGRHTDLIQYIQNLQGK